MTQQGYTLEEVRKQCAELASDVVPVARLCADAVGRLPSDWPRSDAMVLLGSGDSRFAAMASVQAFEMAGVRCEVLTPTQFLCHGSSAARFGTTPTVVGISASGTNPRLLEALRAANERNCETAAITSKPSAPIGRVADFEITVGLGPTPPAPGIRTFQASILALVHLAGRCASTSDRSSDYFTGLDLLEVTSQSQRRTFDLAQPLVESIADMMRSSCHTAVVAPAAHVGTAHYIAAKLSETAGVSASATDLDDWWHVHRFGHEYTRHLIFLIPSGESRNESYVVAERTAERRPVVVVANEGDDQAGRLGRAWIPVAEGLPVVTESLIHPVWAGLLAAELATALGRIPFSQA